ncbi:hypothetical protein ACFOOM_25180 [Streptomyces echinoruber]|jgi:hypothetical protein|uniref:Uncharacterized protein n=1 Tax=Streptomyces echinoruber TaxID=68898 RepID=A0A918RI19_9ACTN|nr:hypothetical protein [Streptomyces echinoruber]GGZ97757.1 hypothetical protein GCM10010389_41240 [Streptomyces echinoruber]
MVERLSARILGAVFGAVLIFAVPAVGLGAAAGPTGGAAHRVAAGILVAQDQRCC